jgi:oligopeptide/dipeptide ABC transporter ATP-binding protein
MVVSAWLPILPGLAIMFTVLSINMLGDGLAAAFDSRLTRAGFRRLRPPATEAPPTEDDPALLSVRRLNVEFPTNEGSVHAVRNVSFDVRPGETLGVVGESGSGKSVTAAAIIQLIDPPGRITSGEVLLEGEDLARVGDQRMKQVRGDRVGMIFQNPTASLNPVFTVGRQLKESFGRDRDRRDLDAEIERTLTSVGIPDPSRVVKQYPFELSGGMNQRIMIAMALTARPQLLIADEPTTALDTTTQAQILEELVALTSEHDISLILITHDIALVSEYADRILVLYAGEVCEVGPVDKVISQPSHPYTRALLESVPRIDSKSERLEAIPGELPDPSESRAGCPFTARCPDVMDVCHRIDPDPIRIGPGHLAACHLWASEHVGVGNP